MTVRELITELGTMDPDLPVFIDLYGSFAEVGSVTDVTPKVSSPSWPIRWVELSAAAP